MLSAVRSQQRRWVSLSMNDASSRRSDAADELSEAERADKLVQSRGIRSDGQTLKWYKEVSVRRIERKSGARWQILLDGRVIATPAGGRLNAPSEQMAQAIALEWASQGKYIRPFTLPIMSLLSTAIDQVPKTRHAIVGNLLKTFNTDTLCLRTSRADNAKLNALQIDQQQPVVDWFQSAFEIPVAVFESSVTGLVASTRQPESSITTLQWYLHNRSDLLLTGLDIAVGSLKSTILAVALAQGRLDAAEAMRLSRMEEDLQIKQWGECEGDHDLDKAELRVRVASASAFIKMIPRDRWQL